MSKNLFISTACIKNKNDVKNIPKMLEMFLENKIFNVEFSGVHKFTNNTVLINHIKKFKKKKMNFLLHNYFPPPKKEIVMNFLSKNKNRLKEAEKIIFNAVKISRKAGIDLYGFHPGYYRDGIIKRDGHFKLFKTKKMTFDKAIVEFEKNLQSMVRQINYDNNKDVFIAIENLFPSKNGEVESFMTNFDELDQVFSLNSMKKNNIGMVLDLGHLQISANHLGFSKFEFLDKVIQKYGDKIYEIHLSENDTIADKHLRIKENSWQLKYLKKLKYLGSKKFKTKFTYESRNLTFEHIKKDREMILDYLP